MSCPAECQDDVSVEQRELCACALRVENAAFAGTGGVSLNARGAGFMPAYCDVHSGAVVVSCFADGRVAPIHVLEGLPEDWVAARDDEGRVVRARAGVVAGFVRRGEFFTREAAAQVLAAEHED